MPNVGYATLQVIPSMKGAQGALATQLAAPAAAAGKSAGAAAGTGVATGMSSKSALVAKAGSKLAKGGVLAIAAIGVGALTASAKFEKSMNKVSAITGATGGDFDALRGQAKKLGSTTAFSASQAADAMTFLGMAGYDTDEILKAMPGTLDLAAASGMDLATTADIMSNVVTGFGKSASYSGRMADIMAKAAASSNTNMQQLGDAMKYVAPVANGAGLSVEQTTAAIGKLSDAGIQGAMAGTTLRGAISRMLSPTKAAKKALDGLGISTSDLQNADGTLRPLDQIITKLGKSGATTGDFMKIFGQRAGPGMQALVAQGTPALDELTKKLKGSGGTAKEMADKQLQGLSGQFTKLKSAAEGLFIAIGDTGVLDGFTKLLEGATSVVSNMATGLPTVQAAVSDFFSALGIGGANGSQKLEQFKTTVSSVITSVKSIFASEVSIISSLWDRFGDTITSFATGTLTNLISAIQGAFTIISGIFKVFSSLLKGDWSGVWEGIKQILSGAWTVIKALVSQGWNAIKTFFSLGITAVTGIFTGLWDVLKSLTSTAITALVGLVIGLWNQIKAQFTTAKDWVVGAFKVAWSVAKTVITTPISLAKSALDTVWSGIKAAFNAVKDFVVGSFKNAWNGLKTILTDPVQAAKNIFNNLLGSGGTIRGIFSAAVKAIGKIWEGLKELAAAPIRFVVNTVYNNGIRKAMNLIPGVNLGEAHIGFASGGEVGGRRLPYGDKVHAMLAPGEEIITNRHGEADRFRAMRKRGMIPGFADGGRVWPANTRALSNNYPGHSGVDIAAAAGSPIKAASSGRVEYTGWGRGFGQAIFSRGLDGLLQIYGHSSRVLTNAGAAVTAGQRIGDVGATGNATGPHLHFEIAQSAPGTPSNRAATLSWLSGAKLTSGSSGGWFAALAKAWEAVKAMPAKFGAWGSVFKGGMGELWDTIKGSMTKLAGQVGEGVSHSPNRGVSGLGQLLSKVFDDGGLATGAGYLPKQTVKPERVLNNRQTVAFEDWMRNGSGPAPVELSADTVRDLATAFASALDGSVLGIEDNGVFADQVIGRLRREDARSVY